MRWFLGLFDAYDYQHHFLSLLETDSNHHRFKLARNTQPRITPLLETDATSAGIQSY